MSRGSQLAGVVLGVAALASAARADWLVLRDGARLEIKGAWKVSGKQVVFTADHGKLSSLRTSLVDLEASTRATEQALRANEVQIEVAPTIAEAPPKARWSLSDKDFAHPTPVATDPSDGAPASPEEDRQAIAQTAPKSDLQILVWSHAVEPSRNRIKVSGTLQNDGKDLATSIALEIQLVDRQGVVVGAQKAEIQKASLSPGEATDFAVHFPTIVTYDTVHFVPTASMFKVDAKETKGKPANTLR